MRVSDLTRRKPIEVKADLGDGDTINLVFDRNAVTPAWLKATDDRRLDKDSLTLPRSLAEVIVSWDVFQNTEGDFPPTPENIAVLSMTTQRELFELIVEVAIPSRAEGNDSSERSSTPQLGSVEPQLMPPNGQVTSPSPSVSASPSPT